jgi:hypothetical protein
VSGIWEVHRLHTVAAQRHAARLIETTALNSPTRTFVKDKPTYFIFDLDNCLSDDAWRIKYIDWDEPDLCKRYAAYHDHAPRDKADPEKRAFFHRIVGERGHTPIFFTGRPTRLRSQTATWLLEELGYDAPNELLMFMRRPGDRSRAADLKSMMLTDAMAYGIPLDSIRGAVDDREDVVEMYKSFGLDSWVVKIHDEDAYRHTDPLPKEPVTATLTTEPLSAADILAEASKTYRERNAVYGSNYRMIKPMLDTLFPAGVPSALVHTHRWHLFELVLVKLSRFAISGLTHQDSIRDLTVYAAMVESLLNEDK